MSTSSTEGHGNEEHASSPTTPAVPDAEPGGLQAKKEPRRLGLVHQWIASFILTISYLIIGSSVGWPSPTLYRIKETGVPFNMTATDKSLMTAIFYVGNMVMPLPGSIMSDYMGRKTSLLIADILPFSSWILIYFATNPAMIHVARLLVGMWSGHTLAVVPLYLAEIADPKIRGALSTLAQTMVNIGDVLAYTVGPAVSYWSLAIIFGSFPVLLFALLFVVPESPHWLIYKRTEDKTAKSVAWYKGTTKDDVRGQVEEMGSNLKSDLNRHEGGFKTIIKSKGNIKALIIVVVLVVSQRLSGISAVMAYSAITLPNKKIWGLTPNDCVIIYGVSWLITTISVIFLVDRFGRIPLLLISCAGCAVSMCTACVWHALNESPDDSDSPWIPFLALFFYGVAYMLGLGPLPTTVQGEMFTPKLKAIASGITAMVASASSAIMMGVFLTVDETHGMYVNFLIYTLVSIGAGFFSFFYVIETKGKSLHEIQTKLNS